MNETVILTFSEIYMAAHSGIMRQVENMQLIRKPAYGAGHDSDWQYNVEGCLGELALAKYLNLYWSGKGVFNGPDAGMFQVRTGSKDHYDLILHKKDKDDDIFWLVCGLNGIYKIKGWLFGWEGKIPKYWGDVYKTGRPAYFVPQSLLRNADELTLLSGFI